MEDMKRLSSIDVAEAAARCREYEQSLAIEGIQMDARDREVMDTIERERMGYEEGVQFAIESCRQDGLIPPAKFADAAE